MTQPITPMHRQPRLRHIAMSLLMVMAAPWAMAQTAAQVHEMAKAQTQPLLGTLKDLVSIESGSRDLEGLEKVATLVANRLQQMGMSVQTIPTQAPASHPQLKGAKLGSVVYATKKGKGQKKVLLIAHMDTVYLKGMLAKQPFRIEGDRAYGLGIADDKQGVAMIVHLIALLRDVKFNEYGTLTVLVDAAAGRRPLTVRDAGLVLEQLRQVNWLQGLGPTATLPRPQSQYAVVGCALQLGFAVLTECQKKGGCDPREIAERVARTAPDATLVRLRNGHSALDTQPMALLNATRRLVRGQHHRLPAEEPALDRLRRTGVSARFPPLLQALAHADTVVRPRR